MLTGCTGYNNLTSLTENGFYYHISSNGKEAIVVYYEWDGQEDTAVIRHGDGSFVCRTPQTKEPSPCLTICDTGQTKEPSLCLPIGIEIDKTAWEAARAETVTIHIPPENVLLLRE